MLDANFWLGVAGTVILLLLGVIGKFISMRNQNIEDNKTKNDAELKIIKDDNDADVKETNSKIDRNLRDAKLEFSNIYTNMTKMERNSNKNFGDVRQDINNMKVATIKEIGELKVSISTIQALCELNSCGKK